MVKLIRKLSEAECRQMFDECLESLKDLNERYSPEVIIENGIPLDTNYLDLVRGSWLVDKSKMRTSHEHIINSLGYLFGLLLERLYGLEWYVVEFEGVEFVSMVKHGKDRALVSVPPYSYVQKREHTENVEVFHDFFQQMESHLNT